MTVFISSSEPAFTLDNLLHARELMSKPRGRFSVRYSPFAYEEVRVKRTWRERLFTRPWHPRQKFRTERKPIICAVDILASHFPALVPSGRIIVAHSSFKDKIDELILERQAND